jgi:hypothetical protein
MPLGVVTVKISERLAMLIAGDARIAASEQICNCATRPGRK